MIAIPLPFVASLLLAVMAGVLFFRREQTTYAAFFFIALCALTSTVVGLRWTTDIAFFKALQPILASCIPVVAWYCFSNAHHRKQLFCLHTLPPIIVILGSLTYPFWQPPLDPLLTLLYVGYGLALIRASFNSNGIPEQVRLSEVDSALKAERYAGLMLLISAVIDGAIGFDFAFFNGVHALHILEIGHAIMLPILAGTVVVMSLSMAPSTQEEQTNRVERNKKSSSINKVSNVTLSDQEIKNIAEKIDALITAKEVFLDPDLTLDRLARKAGIPAKQISIAINQIYGRNVSQVVNEYRIERAKALLITTDKTITQIYLDSGFQTKSNFHREFTRITQQTPSAFRRSHV